jgi:hypothetical protein
MLLLEPNDIKGYASVIETVGYEHSTETSCEFADTCPVSLFASTEKE